MKKMNLNTLVDLGGGATCESAADDILAAAIGTVFGGLFGPVGAIAGAATMTYHMVTAVIDCYKNP